MVGVFAKKDIKSRIIALKSEIRTSRLKIFDLNSEVI